MYIYIYICIYICLYVYKYIYICKKKHTYTYISLSICNHQRQCRFGSVMIGEMLLTTAYGKEGEVCNPTLNCASESLHISVKFLN